MLTAWYNLSCMSVLIDTWRRWPWWTRTYS